MNWAKTCKPCQVRWAAEGGPNCWVCQKPGEDLATVVGHKIRTPAWGFLNPATWPPREEPVEARLDRAEAS